MGNPCRPTHTCIESTVLTQLIFVISSEDRLTANFSIDVAKDLCDEFISGVDMDSDGISRAAKRLCDVLGNSLVLRGRNTLSLVGI